MSDERSPSGDDLPKMPTGIDGLDEITGGGLPRGRTTLVVGGPGSGKTVLGLQVLVNGARQWREPGILVTFEERAAQIVANAASFGWDLPALQERDLFFLDGRSPAGLVAGGDFDLTGLLASLTAKSEEMGTRRIVFDSVDVLLAVLDDRPAERRELYRIHDWLASSGLTGVITTRGQEGQLPGTLRHEFLQFMADCVVVLHHRVSDLVSLRGLRVVKYRGSGFGENEAPMLIGPRGMEVGSFVRPAGAGSSAVVSNERISTGIARLDAMLRGGLYRGTSTLVTGAPGTAKSSLCGAFVEAACRRGERTLYVSFDEPAGQIVRNMASVNIDLAPHLDSGMLRLQSLQAESQSAEAHLLGMKALIVEHKPRCLALDPMSALVKAGGQLPSLGVAQRLLHLVKSQGITLMCTSMLEDRGQAISEASLLPISTLADNWIHLSYHEQGGERNRALSIVKARGIGHSNQVRELVLSDEGLDLAEPYTAGGQVLMGTLRWEREINEAQEQERQRAEMEARRLELERANLETQARIQALQRELEARRVELARLTGLEEDREVSWSEKQMELTRRRGAQAGATEPDAPRAEPGA